MLTIFRFLLLLGCLSPTALAICSDEWSQPKSEFERYIDRLKSLGFAVSSFEEKVLGRGIEITSVDSSFSREWERAIDAVQSFGGKLVVTESSFSSNRRDISIFHSSSNAIVVSPSVLLRSTFSPLLWRLIANLKLNGRYLFGFYPLMQTVLSYRDSSGLSLHDVVGEIVLTNEMMLNTTWKWSQADHQGLAQSELLEVNKGIQRHIAVLSSFELQDVRIKRGSPPLHSYDLDEGESIDHAQWMKRSHLWSWVSSKAGNRIIVPGYYDPASMKVHLENLKRMLSGLGHLYGSMISNLENIGSATLGLAMAQEINRLKVWCERNMQ